MLLCEEVADSWRDIEEQKADLEVQLRETEQHLQNLIRRPAELEPKIAQNQLDKAQVCDWPVCVILKDSCYISLFYNKHCMSLSMQTFRIIQ